MIRPAAPARKSTVQEGLAPASKIARSEWAILHIQEGAAYPRCRVCEHLVSNEVNQNGSIACAVVVPVSSQADMDDMWMTARRFVAKAMSGRRGVKK